VDQNAAIFEHVQTFDDILLP